MSSERLIYLPLGGAGEIGMNCYVYGYGRPGHERLIVVDLGVTFPDMDGTPGVDLIFADVSWLEARRDQIEAVFLTHAHEDHIGATGLTWEALRAPMYARRFTGNHIARKLGERGAPEETLTVVDAYPRWIDAGPFRVSFLPVSHSVPESSGLVIDTPKGRVIHTGDFKIDRTPVVGEPFDESLWKEVSKDGVQALICDSTNVFSRHEGRSEASLTSDITHLMQDQPGMVVATTFASNVARVKTLADAATAAGRSVCLLGRAMRRMIEAAVAEGILDDFPPTISPEDAKELPRDSLCLLVTGSQGERRAASAQLANGKYMGITMAEGDTFLFSSKTIPGNERGVIRIINQLSEMGVDVIDDSHGDYHVSGHANRPDLERMHAIVDPKIVIPMHGEHRHLREHARLVQSNGRASMVAVNGMMVDLSAADPRVAEHVETGRTYLDGKVQIGALDGVVRDRIRMALFGQVIVTLILDEQDEPLGDVWCEINGLPEVGQSGSALVEVLERELTQVVARAPAKLIRDDTGLEKELVRRAKGATVGEIGKKPEVTVIISRLA